MENEVLIKLVNVSKTFPGVKALDSIDLEIKKGEVHALVGENGAGKSTLIKILSGVYVPDADSVITIEGSNLTHLTPISAVRQGIAVTYQDFSLLPNLSVAENIAISQEIEGGEKIISWVKMRETAKAAIEKVGVEIDVNLPLGSLSVAKQQLVAIARALVCNAKIIILDEPTSSLSKNEVEVLYKIIANLKQKNISILFISHKLDEIFEVSDRITVLRDGRCMGTYNKDDLNTEKLISLMVGRSVEFEYKKNEGITDTPLLEVKNLTKEGNYKDISFTLHKGEILGLTGLVGAGRTEVCQSIFGITQPDSGLILIDGKQARIKDTADAVRRGIAFVPENRQAQGLILRQSVEDNIVLTVLQSLVSKINLIKRKEKNKSALKWIGRLNIKPGFPEMPVSKLSGGNQQRVVIAKWLSSKPKILIIDEPTNGIDVGAKQEIHEILRNLAREGMGIIMISSELPEILSVSDRILVMRRGRIAAEFKGGTATQEQIMGKAVLSR